MKTILDFNNLPLGKELDDLVSSTERLISVFGLYEGDRVLVANAFSKGLPVLYVCDDYFAANNIYAQLSAIHPSVVNLPSIDDVLSDRTYNNFNSQQRLHALNKISQGVDIIVTTVASCLQPCADIHEFKARTMSIVSGSVYDVDELCHTLHENGYSRVETVVESGQYCWRGNIVDIWVAGDSIPVRLDFFGDDLETIKQFDPESRLSNEIVDSISVVPNLECGSTKLKNIIGECTVLFDDIKAVADAKERVLQEHTNRIAILLDSEQISAHNVVELYADGLEFEYKQVAFHRDLSQNRIFTPKALFNIKSFQIHDYSRNFEGLVHELHKWHNQGYETTLCATDGNQLEILEKLISNHSIQGVTTTISRLAHGAKMGSRILVGHADLFKKTVQKVKKSKAHLFSEITPGDYVVHHIHGIGKYERAERLDLNGSMRDYLVVKYKNDDTLYVPAESMDSLSKYSSNTTPTLNRIGGQEFERVKDRVKQGVKKMALDLLALYAQREQAKGIKYNIDERAFSDFENAFEHSPTDCQVDATKDILADLSKGKVMDRLICGDVGYGKTEVAMRAAYCAVLEGYQVAFVCPTTILAKQHARSLQKRMSEFGIVIAEFSRFESKKQIALNLENLALGKVDIAVGTHRLLQKDVEFKQLGILVLDEEQRFGVADKEKIKRLKTDVNVLTLSATPIPRTLHMGLQSIRDISVLDTPPKARLPIQTYVSEYTDAVLRDAIIRELGRGGAAFVVYNNVADMPSFVARLQYLLPQAKFSMAHGQQSSEVMEDAVQKFIDGETNVLVASTIIENGVDMPHANTMIVLDSDRLGLAQMYQLRGRVGRSDRQAYVYFTYDGRKTISDTARKRLDAITEFTEFGSGFKLAMRDLEIRGAGNILGREQHGHMDKVGYDMYCKLLNDTVNELRGKTTREYTEVKVITDLPSFLPDDYILEKQAKLDVYSRIAILYTLQDRVALQSELTDIYGKPPTSVTNLLSIGLFKNLASKLGASTLTLNKKNFSITFDKVSNISKALVSVMGDNVVSSVNGRPTVTFKDAGSMMGVLMKASE